MNKGICALIIVILSIFLLTEGSAMADYIHPIKEAQHSLDVTLKTDAARKEYFQAMVDFALANDFDFDVGKRDAKGNTIMITLTGRNTSLSSTSVLTRTTFNTYIYANSDKADDVNVTDDIAKKFENFLHTKSFLTFEIEY